VRRACAIVVFLAITIPSGCGQGVVDPHRSPSTAPSVASDSQPSFPIRAAFYYPWFPEAWKQEGFNPFTKYHPALGFYDSSSSAVIQSHVASMQAAGLTAGISSWWGQNTPTDTRISALLANAGSFRWALYYEQEGTADPSVAQIHADLAYIARNYAAQPAFLRVDGRPVVFVYGGGDDGCGMADRWKAANLGIDAYTDLKIFPGYRACTSQPDSWHQYAPAIARDHQAAYAFTISPGFNKRSEAEPRLVRDLARWASDVAAMKASGESWQLVTTFSEWGEGTQVEASTEFGNDYLDALGTGLAGPTATSVPIPTSTPLP
jgi:Glycosyl hydrolase family 99